MPSFRSQHWLDEPHPSKTRQRRRTIRNWMHFRAPPQGRPVAHDGDAWQTSQVALTPAAGTPTNWVGRFDFAHLSMESPLQAFIGDTSDPDNSALYGCRLADRPNNWINWKAHGVTAGVVPTVDETGATWANLWPGASLRVQHAVHKLTKVITINSRTAPTKYVFTLRLHAGGTAQLVNQSYLIIRDAQGTEVMRTKPVWGQDSSTTAPTPDGRQVMRVTMEDEGQIVVPGTGRLKAFSLNIHPDDLATGTLPIEIDPTTTIGPSTTACEDNYLNGVAAGNNNNYGGLTTMYVGNVNKYRGLLRVSTADIPSGTINSATWTFYIIGSATYPRTWSAWAMTDASVWVEGTGTPAAETGSSCWNKMVYNTTNWPGSVGAGTSGTDFTADASPPGVSVTARDAWYSLSLKTSWFSDWKSGSRVNNGWTARFTDDSYHQCCAQEYTSDPTKRWYVTVDYVLGGAASMLARRMHG